MDRAPRAAGRLAGTGGLVLALLALTAGMAVGLLLHGSPGGPAEAVAAPPAWAALLEAAGVLWVRALRMVVVPLVFLLVLAGAARAAAGGSILRLGGGAVAAIVGLLLFGALFALAVTPPLLGLLGAGGAESFVELAAALEGDAEELRGRLAQAPRDPGAWGFLRALVPENPVASAARGELLALVFFAALVGVAAGAVEAGGGAPVVELARAGADVTLRLAAWMLVLAPLGILGLGLRAGRLAGPELAGLLARYLIVICGVLVLSTLALYPVAVLVGRVRLGAFAGALLPAQALALSTRSSLASLPALIEGVRRRLPERFAAAEVTLPVSAAVFKLSWMPVGVVKLLVLARLYDLELTVGHLVVFLGTQAVMSTASVGLPLGGGVPRGMPAFLAVGVPLEGYLLLFAVNVLPDVFETLLNVTAYGTVGVVARAERGCPLAGSRLK